ncbi:MAG TPA: nucleotidyltransferase domain-containing protein [Anaerolineae bacterium]|nr:nucleotidyltransferase domain-containing protein [Anaerolineae bacterium]
MSTAGARRASQQARRAKRNGRKAPPSFYWWPITDAKIRRAAQRIVAAVHPEKIILFGSFAYGKPTPDSDVDLLVIMESNLRPHARVVQISDILDPRPFPVDIIVRTPSEIAERLRAGDCFFREILSKGRVLYERASRG